MTIRLGIPSNDRMFDTIFNLFKNAEIPLIRSNRSNFGAGKIWKEIEVTYLRSRDIPHSLFAEGLDIGITTDNVLVELNKNLPILLRFNFGEHRVVLAAKEKYALEYFEGKTIATAYPVITRKFFKEKGIKNVKIMDLSGSIEAYPRLNLADGIVDIVETGTSLKENGLVEIETIMHASPILISRNDIEVDKTASIDFIKSSLIAAMKAEDYKKLICKINQEHTTDFETICKKYQVFGLTEIYKSRFEIFISKNLVSKFMKEVSIKIPDIFMEIFSPQMIFCAKE